MKRRIIAAAVVLVMLFALVACSGATQNPLVGIWSYPLGTIQFKADGEFVAYVFGMSNTGTWSEKNGKITTVVNGETETVAYTLSGDTLVIEGVTYTRVK